MSIIIKIAICQLVGILNLLVASPDSKHIFRNQWIFFLPDAHVHFLNPVHTILDPQINIHARSHRKHTSHSNF
jgi:hypothetical protein